MSDEGGIHQRTISCEEVERRLPALVAGDLDLGRMAEIRAHTSRCPECALDLRQSESLSGLLALLAPAAPRRNGYSQPTPLSPETEPARPASRFVLNLRSKLERLAVWGPVDTDVGRLHVVATDRGLCKVCFPDLDGDDVENWCHEQELVPLFDEDEIEPYAAQLRDYFSGRRRAFDLPIDLRTATPFLRTVLQALQTIPYGDLRNYREIASQVGNPRAQRAVGNAVKRNPVPIVIPCHRVIRTDGHIGGYAGGPTMKERLLKLEGALLVS